ncbi:glycerophosphodiester phosphodiesterase [Xylophilus rhododendri]|uniref:glycerophosphodiester phosphodiesterase n=1 Tax=Xylophilus rhododendri TaxID=2697032 RepID=UPI001E592212|nr:glycerophosphodiester phosphodiesterase [Xylophilus rhododendri]
MSSSCVLAFDLQGHRGARGLMPENTLAAFEAGASAGVSTLELDIAVTADGIPVISHDPRLNPAFTRDEKGAWIQGQGPAIHALRLDELRRYDVGRLDPGSRYAAGLPRQMPRDGQRIPTLRELLRLLGTPAFAARPLQLNIETKSDPFHPELQPPPEEFVTRIVAVLREAGFERRATLQSFDWRTLAAARRLAPEIPRACLSTPKTLQDPAWTDGRRQADFASAPAMAADAGCAIWSPAFAGLDAAQVNEAHRLGLAVLPWTVNRPEDMKRLIDLGVDGLISDEPDLALPLLREKGLAVAPLPRP